MVKHLPREENNKSKEKKSKSINHLPVFFFYSVSYVDGKASRDNTQKSKRP